MLFFSDKQKFLNIVRFGVLNSMHPDVRKIAPQNLKNQNSSAQPTGQCEQIKSMLGAKNSLQDEIEKLKKSPNSHNTFTRDKIKECEKRLNQITEAIELKTNVSTTTTNKSNDFDGIDGIMANARVVFSTLSSSINLKQYAFIGQIMQPTILSNSNVCLFDFRYVRKFDVCFIDEASQCTEPWSLVPLQYNITSLILVGDSHQLSPVVLSPVIKWKRKPIIFIGSVSFIDSKTSQRSKVAESKSENCVTSLTFDYDMNAFYFFFSDTLIM